MSENKLTPEELDSATKIHDKIVNFLSVRYLSIIIIISLLSPILGLLIGAFLEGRYFSSTREQILADAKAELADQVTAAQTESSKAKEEIQRISREAREYLDEIRSTRESLNFVLTGTAKGEVAFLQNRSKEVEEQLETFKTELEKWEEELNTSVPQDLRKLGDSAEELKRLQSAVARLERLFTENQSAGALAGAFYKIYEFLGVLEVSLYMPNNIRSSDIALIKSLANDVQAEVTFMKKGQEADGDVLSWPQGQVKATVSVEDLETSAPTLPGNNPPLDSVVKLRFELSNQESWWNVQDASTARVKAVDIDDFSNFDVVNLSIAIPHAKSKALDALSLCHYNKLPCPRLLALQVNVNRELLRLQHVNGDDIAASKLTQPFFGIPIETEASVAAVAEPASPEKPGTLLLRFEKTKVFEDAADEYVRILAKKGNAK